ncbi:hypothetical protein P691DRAFT_777552 [Macrolepiota fuliginosa MF-IS2]|uniref:MFS general substrate transporter n=1 Tax=Macrolepiota fuliginosa MF-IS2 TaxID=1400762 RepID=A0A9P6BZJ7_9AGAR|nr:hypothetical protein P691DRAFT_777552 [Macrolepiota fuliginosa MF-IS2]
MSPRIQVYKAIACRALNDTTTTMIDIADSTNCGDPAVQARAAKIQAAVVTLMSVLSAISTGFWSRLGDTHGRKPILVIFISGALAMEAVFVLVMSPYSFFNRHAERLILVGPFIEGFVGGISTFNGIFHAYVSDCTRHGSRSRIFSAIQGIVFVGLSLGPWFGGLFLPKTGYSDSFFFCSITLLISTILYLLFICPESRFPSHDAADSYAGDFLAFKTSPLQAARRLTTKFISAVVSPIAIFAPKRTRGTNQRSWNMTLVGLSFFIYCVSIGIYSAKYLYAQHVYSWTTAQSTQSTLIISYLKPKPTSPPGTQSSPSDVAAELVFDKYLAQASLFVDGVADTLVAVISNKSQPMFVVVSCLSSFTSGGNPALHSLGAICLHALGYSDDVGAMFGAFGVLNSVAHIISPTIYATIYGATVASFPQAIFVMAACLLFTIVALLFKVWPASVTPYSVAHSGNAADRDSVDVEVSGGLDYPNPLGVDAGVGTTGIEVGNDELRPRPAEGRPMSGSGYKYDGVGSSPPRASAGGMESR